MTPEQERETLRQMVFGSLALELPPRAFEILLDLWVRLDRDYQEGKAA
jgi:hypothetical protein